MSASARSFWLTNHVANPLLRAVLRSRLGSGVGGRLAILSYRGRRTGTRHELVVQYVRDGRTVWIVSGQPGRKSWWRNFRSPGEVNVWLAGRGVTGTAVAIDSGSRPDEVAAALRIYQEALPGAHTRENPDSGQGPGTVIVRVDLDGERRTDSLTSGATL
jgi:hypothetical protein